MKLFLQFNWIFRTYINAKGIKNVHKTLLELILQQDKIVYMIYVTHLKGLLIEKKLLIVSIILMVYIAVNF